MYTLLLHLLSLLHLSFTGNIIIVVVAVLLVYLLLWWRVKTLKVTPVSLTLTFK
jgi:hypothetical protein